MGALTYWRPLLQTGPSRPNDALTLGGGWTWFTHVERREAGAEGQVVPANALPEDVRLRLTANRPALGHLSFDRPRIMAILNATPDSFSDGGQFETRNQAIVAARKLAADGADIVDIGGESTRPGATEVPLSDEIARTAPLIRALRVDFDGAISIDTRKAKVAEAAIYAGADMLNDVSALTFDPDMADTAAASGLPVCLMHAQGDPQTMQDAPHYDDVVADVYDHLAARIDVAEARGIPRARIVVDPGIGFGKTLQHNLALLANLSVFHALGCPVLVGASRKKFIGTLGRAPRTSERLPGSLAVALAAIAQGAQIVRVHDMAQTRQAVDLWRAATIGEVP
ncbi:dihydropteroate synthase [Palleronia abyssalis]|uniref:Dihydropteroate synthase n=1 Tax=Palleronia abyssalis TaxID=1501240 RepID=A0A2R8C006_9RHOB|nr:dihydropteroate synthase [Palleronia abyssalis]SPJ25748.1 Dihydropteroate synthase [Palleronia abyssalis]